MNRGARLSATIVGIVATLQVCGTCSVRAQTAALVSPNDNRAEEKQPDEAKSLTEVNKELSNPISSIWSLMFQRIPTG